MGKKKSKGKTGKGKASASKSAKRIKKKKSKYRRAAPPHLRKREDWIPAFLKEYAQHGNQTKAAEAVGKDRATISRLKSDDNEFAAAMEQCFEGLTDQIEASVVEHAIAGYDDPVFHEGEIIGYRRRYSPAERILMLKKRRTLRYGDESLGQSSDPAEAAREALAYLKLIDSEGFVPGPPEDE